MNANDKKFLETYFEEIAEIWTLYLVDKKISMSDRDNRLSYFRNRLDQIKKKR